MPVVVDESNKIIWVVPPKNGCSTVRLSIGKCFFKDIEFKSSNYIYDEKFQNLAKKYSNNHQSSEMRVIFVYRNLIKKFDSFLRSILYGRLNLIRTTPEALEKDEKWKIYLSLFEKEENQQLSNETNLETIFSFQEKIKTKYKYKYPGGIDHHGFSQIYYLNNFLKEWKFINEEKIEYISIDNIKPLMNNLYSSDLLSNSSNNSLPKEKNSKKLNEIKLKDIFLYDLSENKHYIDAVHNLYNDDVNFFSSKNINFD